MTYKLNYASCALRSYMRKNCFMYDLSFKSSQILQEAISYYDEPKKAVWKITKNSNFLNTYKHCRQQFIFLSSMMLMKNYSPTYEDYKKFFNSNKEMLMTVFALLPHEHDMIIHQMKIDAVPNLNSTLGNLENYFSQIIEFFELREIWYIPKNITSLNEIPERKHTIFFDGLSK